VLLVGSTALLATRLGILWSWAIPMALSVVIVNSFIVGKLAGQQARQRPKLPPVGELGRFIAIESVTTAVSAAVSAFLPVLVTRRLGAAQGAYFYVPWIVTSMAGLLLTSILISMVREAVANPEKASATIRRSLGLIMAVLFIGTVGCLLLSGLVLAPLGHAYVAYGTPVLRWTGLALPAMAINYLYWATCLTRKRPWPIFTLNLAQSIGVIGGVMLLGRGSDIGSVGEIYCLVQWVVALVVSIPTYKAVRAIRGH
jgi:O-antigen/teichoic acid export membrane protein